MNHFKKIFYNVIVVSSTASHSKSSFDVILVNITSTATLNEDSLKLLLNLLKPKAKVVFLTTKIDDLESGLVLSGFVNVKYDAEKNCKS